MKLMTDNQIDTEVRFTEYQSRLRHNLLYSSFVRVIFAVLVSYLIAHFLDLTVGAYTPIISLLILASLYQFHNYDNLKLLRYSNLHEYLTSEIHKEQPTLINDFIKSQGLLSDIDSYTDKLLDPVSRDDLMEYKSMNESDPLKLLKGLSIYGQANRVFLKEFYYGDLKYYPNNLKLLIDMAQKLCLYKSYYDDPQSLYDENVNEILRSMKLPVPTITPTSSLLNDDQNYYLRVICILIKNSFTDSLSPYYKVVRFINSYNTFYLSLKTYSDSTSTLNDYKRDRSKLSEELTKELDQVITEPMKIRLESLYTYLTHHGAKEYTLNYGDEATEISESLVANLIQNTNRVVEAIK